MRMEAGYLSRLAAEQYGDSVALTGPNGSLTFTELNQRANRIGSATRSLGATPGDRIGVLAYNRPEVVESWLGFEKHALVRVVLHSHFDMAAHVASLNHVGAVGLLFDTRFVDQVDAARSQLHTVRHFVALGDDCPDWAVSYEDLVASGDPEDQYLSVDEDAPCFLQLTSGTTGLPKAWTKTYRSWLAVINQNLHHLDTFGAAPPVSQDDVNLHFHPLQWASGFQTLYPYLVRGARTVVVDDSSFDPDGLVDTLVGEGVTGTLMPGPLLSPVLDVVQARGGIEHRMRRMVVFFATPEQLHRTTQVLGAVWCHGFGSTEQGAVTTRLLPGDVAQGPERIGSVGRVAAPMIEVAVVDASGRRQPAGVVGEIVVRSPMSQGYYWGLPEKTASSYFADDWFRPEDVGYLDDDGFLYYSDRAADTITLEAGAVYPHLVEAAVLTHEAVANCGVVGLGPDGDIRVVAAVQLMPGIEDSGALRELILKAAADRLRGFERPAEVVVVGELPTVLGGAKVQRGELRSRLARQADG